MKNCKGCARLTNVVCLYKHWDKTDTCPCKDCLIKMVCIDECEEREVGITRLVKTHIINERSST